jgi:hypothetical protein
VGNFDKDGAPNGRGAPQNKHYETASDRAGKLVERFPVINTRHHKELHSTLAEAAEFQKMLIDNPFEYNKFIDNYFSEYSTA